MTDFTQMFFRASAVSMQSYALYCIKQCGVIKLYTCNSIGNSIILIPFHLLVQSTLVTTKPVKKYLITTNTS